MTTTKIRSVAAALLTSSVFVLGLLLLARASDNNTTVSSGVDAPSSADTASADASRDDVYSGEGSATDLGSATDTASSEAVEQTYDSLPEYLQPDERDRSDAVTDPEDGHTNPDSNQGSGLGQDAEDPEVIDGTPGVVTGNSEFPPTPVTDPPPAMEVVALIPVPKPATPLPALDPIDIVEVGGNGSSGSGVASELAVPTASTPGQFAPNVSGCALACVQKAALQPNVSTPNLGIDVAVTVPARIDITLTNRETGAESLFTSSGFKTRWATTLSPLASATEYDLVLEAFDEEGQRQVHTHTLTTRAPLNNPDQLQDNQPGCAGACITRATVTPTERHDEVRFDIETNTPASVKVWMSTSEPGWIDDTPFLPAESIVEPTTGVRTDFSVEKSGLDPDTRYHVIVRAEDDHGVDYQVGDFTSAPPPPVNVRLTFEQIFVRWDGDPRPLDRGELAFTWGLNDGDLDSTDVIGHRTEEKMHGGRIIDLTSNNEVWLTLDEDDEFLAPGVTATEYDDPPGADFGGPGFPSLVERPVDNRGYGRKNPAWGYPLTLDNIKSMPTCGDIGFTNALPYDYCVSLFSPASNDDQYPQIQVIVSYHIDQ